MQSREGGKGGLQLKLLVGTKGTRSPYHRRYHSTYLLFWRRGLVPCASCLVPCALCLVRACLLLLSAHSASASVVCGWVVRPVGKGRSMSHLPMLDQRWTMPNHAIN